MITNSANTVNKIRAQLDSYFQQLGDYDAPPADVLSELPEIADMSAQLTTEMRETLLQADTPEHQVMELLGSLNTAAKTYNALLMTKSTREDALTTFKNAATETSEDGE